MNERQRNMLSMLLTNNNQLVNVRGLSEILGCSDKTVRNDLNVLDAYLKDFNGITLMRKRGAGIRVEASEAVQKEVFQKINQLPIMTDEERFIDIAYELLTSIQPLTLSYFAKRHFIHTTLVKEDMERISEWLQTFELKIVMKQRVGTVVEGEEFNKRKALAHLSELVTTGTETNVLDFFHEAMVGVVKQQLIQVLAKFDITVKADSMDGLLTHALIMMKRTKQQKPVKIPNAKANETMETKAYEVTTTLFDTLEKQLSVKIPTNERIYYAWHISAAMEQSDFLGQDEMYNEQVKMTGQLIENVQALINIPIQEDKVLYDGLMVHLSAALKRIQYDLHITNPMLQEIKKSYPYLFSMVIFAVSEWKTTYRIILPEEEIAYLVLHFQASMERMGKKKSLKKTVIVCHLGLGMSLLLKAKLEQQYKGLEIVDTIGEHELSRLLQEIRTVDLIISTVPLKQETPHVFISPLLDQQDKAKLDKFLTKDAKDLQTASYHTLYRCIDEGLFQIGLKLTHPFEIVERLANQLVRLDLVEEDFPHQMLQRERASFTSIGGKIAIPHAPPETVKQTTISLAILKKSTEWGREMVELVFVLAVSKEDRFMTKDLLRELSNLSQDPEKITAIIQAETKEAVLTVLETN